MRKEGAQVEGDRQTLLFLRAPIKQMLRSQQPVFVRQEEISDSCGNISKAGTTVDR